MKVSISLGEPVAEGWFGHIHYAHGSIPTDLPPNIRHPLAFHPGGMMFELACHLIDMTVLLFGVPGKITPFLRHDSELNDRLADNTLAVFEYERMLAVIESSFMETAAGERRIYEVCGSDGTIILQPIEPPAIRLCLRKPTAGYQAGWQRVEVKHIPRYVRDFEELARCIRGEQHFPYSREHDCFVQQILLRASGVG